ncbi:Uncharacterised protein [Vibrio cholerae]|nr:Uncharacterised protein [Vibrio cholerae]CSI52560.1 Uncharacterised protein [Vibrio cholerae]
MESHHPRLRQRRQNLDQAQQVQFSAIRDRIDHDHLTDERTYLPLPIYHEWFHGKPPEVYLRYNRHQTHVSCDRR